MYQVAPGATSQSLQFYLRDSITGQPRTGLTAATPGAQAGYVRQGGSSVAITLVDLATPTSPWVSGGFIENDPALTPGMYRCDIPDAAFAVGASFVSVTMNFGGTLGEGVLVLLQTPVSNVGPGALSWTVTVLDGSTSAPVAGASVWVSTDQAGTNVIAGAIPTSSGGQVAFLLGTGTYWLWVVCQGYASGAPTQFTVAAAGGVSVSLTPSTPPPSLTQAVTHEPRFTSYDMVERLVDYLGADPGEATFRQARRAILDALKHISTAHKWTYLLGLYRLQLNGQQSTGTVEYRYDSGSYPRQLTLTDATWPWWASGAYGACVRISNIVGQLDRRVSDTIVTLADPVSYDHDLPAGTGYELYRDTYTLPGDFAGSDNALAETMWGPLEYVSPASYYSRQRYVDSYGTPRWWTVVGDIAIPGRLSLVIYPHPDVDTTLDFVYQRRARPIVHFDVSNGMATIDVAVNPNLVTFTQPVLKANMLGSVLRLSATSDVPTGLDGLTPYDLEGNITSTLTSSSCLIDQAATSNYTAVGYRISDPIDFEDLAMCTAFCRCAEYHVSVSRMMKTRGDAKAAFEESLKVAKEADARVQSERAAGLYVSRRPRTAFMPRGPDIS